VNDSTSKALPKGKSLTPLDPAYRQDPYPLLKRVREEAPVFFDEEFKHWYVTRFEDVRQILRDKEMSVDPRKANPDSHAAKTGAVSSPEHGDLTANLMLFMDDPEHRRVRGLVSKAFTPKAVEALRPRIRQNAQSLLQEIIENEFDLMASYAEPLPVITISEMLGIDAQHRVAFKRWSEIVVSTFYNRFRSDEETERGLNALQELKTYLLGIIELRRGAPTSDLISGMVHAEENGNRLTADEILRQTVLLLMAGNMTTTDLIGNGVRALLQHPEQLAKLRMRPDLIANTVEEVLRYDSPVTSGERIVRQDAVVAGCPMRAGQSISLSLAAANHDPSVHEHPDRLNIEREGIHHQSFGGGNHLCLGAPLARVEAQEAILALLDRFAHIELSPRGYYFRAVPTVRGTKELWLRIAK